VSVRQTFAVVDEIGGTVSFTAYDPREVGNDFLQVEVNADEEAGVVDIPVGDLERLEDFVRQCRLDVARESRNREISEHSPTTAPPAPTAPF
jgi:hypothetical protein